MSFYNVMFGKNNMSDSILATLGLTTGDFGRFRDCFVADGKIAVYTRNGGGNREYLQDVFDKLETHPCYLYFKFPKEYAKELKKLDSGEKFDPSERWLSAVEALKSR